MEKEFLSSNFGHYYINNYRVTEEQWYRELADEKLNRIEEKLDLLIKKNENRSKQKS